MIKKYQKSIIFLSVFAVIAVCQFGFTSNTAHAAITFVGSSTASTGSLASYDISLTALTGGLASAPAEGDLVIVSAITSSTTDQDMSVSGYTEIADLFSDDTRDVNLYVGYKIMGAVPDTSITVPGGGASTAAIANVQVWRGVDQSNPLDSAATTTTGINGLVANPPAATSTTPGSVYSLVYGSSGSPVRIPPTTLDYSMGLFQSGTGNAILGMAALFTHSVDHSYDPPAWSNAFSNSQDSWAAVTIPLRPATPLPGYYVDIGESAGVAGGAMTVPWPAHQAGDIGLLVVESRDNESVLSNSVGFTRLGITAYGTTGSASRLDVFWARATSSSMASPELAGNSAHQYGRILTFRGIPSNNVPYVSWATAVSTSSQTMQYVPSATSTSENQIVVMLATSAADTTNGSYGTTFTNPLLRWIAERNDAGTSQGDGGGFLAITSLTEAGGDTGITEVVSSANGVGMMTIIFNNQVSEGTTNATRAFGKFLNTRIKFSGGRILLK